VCYDVDLEKQIELVSCGQIPDYNTTTCKSLKTVVDLQCLSCVITKNDIYNEMKSERV
jgi:hypothetical protein